MASTFTDEMIIEYAKRRLFGSNVRPDEVHKIELHNGQLPSMLEAELSSGTKPVLLDQENGREPIYFRDGTLYIPQYSGHGRARRYQRMIEEYLRASDKGISFELCDARNEEGKRDPRQTNLNYDNFSYDHSMRLLVPSSRYEGERVFSSEDVGMIDTIVFGSTDAMAEQSDVIEKGKSQYLDSQILEIAGKKGPKRVLNIGYVYSDQAGRLLDDLFLEYDALAKQQGRDRSLSIFLFGDVGGLMDGLKRNQLVFPSGIIDEADLYRKDGKGQPWDGNYLYPMYNILSKEYYGQPKDDKKLANSKLSDRLAGLTLNVNSSILDETIEMLSLAVEKGAICTDMELMEMTNSINRARTRYPVSSRQNSTPGLDISFGFVGIVSDLPLKGDTRAKELEDDSGERDAVSVILEKINKI